MICPLCDIIAGKEEAHLTDWHFWSEELGAVVTDLKPGPGGARRLMYVFPEHKHIEQVTSRDRALAHRILIDVAEGVSRETGLQLTGLDYEMSIPQHYHIQAILSDLGGVHPKAALIETPASRRGIVTWRDL